MVKVNHANLNKTYIRGDSESEVNLAFPNSDPLALLETTSMTRSFATAAQAAFVCVDCDMMSVLGKNVGTGHDVHCAICMPTCFGTIMMISEMYSGPAFHTNVALLILPLASTLGRWASATTSSDSDPGLVLCLS